MAKVDPILKRRLAIEKKIKGLEIELRQLQKECKHPKETLKKEPHGDTGNWCPQDDSWWYTFDCGICDKHWTEPQ